jgi:tetratricopeptide (TPR) repeat protein
MSKILTGFVIGLLIVVYVFAQQTVGHFYITGKVKVEQGLVDQTNIQVTRNGALLMNVTVNQTGNFRMKVELNHIYRFQFSKDGFYPKTIEIDTHVPAEVASVNTNFPPYQLALMLFKKVPGVEESVSEVGRVSYNPQIDNFDAEMLRQKDPFKNELQKILQDIQVESRNYDEQKKKTRNEKYQQTIAEAEQLYRQKQYENAMHRYRDAVMIFPQNLNPRKQVNVLYALLVEEQLYATLGAPVEENFLKYLNYGDLKFREREYTVAKVCYEKASQIRPENNVVKNKLNDSNQEFQKLQELAIEEVKHHQTVYAARTQKYNELVKQADEKFLKEFYAEAKDFYAQAITQIDENSHAVLMIRKIDEMISSDEAALKLAKEREAAERERLLNARNQAYNDAVKEADRMLGQRLYRDAIEYYELALTIKSYEMYPQLQIRTIREILADLQLKGDEYNDLIRKADVLFYEKKYQEARGQYQQAHELIPNERYAHQKIIDIDHILAMQNKEQETVSKYRTLLGAADQLFENKKYTEAITAYQQASMVQPNEDYPKQQIKKIRGILSGEADAQKRIVQQQNDYNQVIQLADQAFNQQSYARSRSLYQEALQIIPGQEYPSAQIAKIDGIMRLKNQQETGGSKLDLIDFSNLESISKEDRLSAFDEAMTKGESFIQSKEWGIARFYFRRAISLFPDHALAGQKLKEVEEQILGANVNEVKYNEMIKKADEAYKTGDFGVAKFYYTKAKEANPEDDYVNERLNVVTKLSESTANRTANREFDAAVQKGNDAMISQNYSVARFFYRKALSLRPNDDDIKQRLLQVETLINQK